MKKKSGNISILIIFILLASSLLGILSMNFVQQMMKQSSVINSYYKSYYLSKAGIELGFVQIKHRSIGFDYVVHTGDSVVVDNFLCEPNCSLATTLSGTATLLSQKFRQSSGCVTPYMLSGGESLIVPLFRDTTSGPVANTLISDMQYENLARIFKDDQINVISKLPGDITYGMIILSGEELSPNGIFFKKGLLSPQGLSTFRNAFETYLATIDPGYQLESQLKNQYGNDWLIDNGFKIYLLISNSTDTQQAFCLSVAQSHIPSQANILPTDNFFIQSQASYGNQKVALDASYAQPIPGFLFNTYTSFQ